MARPHRAATSRPVPKGGRSGGANRPAQRLAELGLTLPAPPQPVASYLPAVETGRLLFVSGMLPLQQGTMLHPGRLGDGVTVEEGVLAARQAALNGLAVVAAVAGTLDRVVKVVRVNGYVASAASFTQQPAVMNGASDLLVSVFGPGGRHSRVAVGVAVLPLNAPVELDLVVELHPSRARPRPGSRFRR
ncbi:MAG TPA: RidA family protein [Nitrospiria bacterium]|nr:RidA family protein [Nitrospiria bacterium]